MPLTIDYESRGFPPGSGIAAGWGELQTNWDDLMWAAITIGRPDWVHVFGYGNSSVYEAIFRWAMLRTALEQSGPTAYRLRRTPAARALDPTEKGAINYFVGMVMCKLFAARLLNAPWMLHLDVFGAAITTVMTGRSRPDLVGQINGTNQWIAMESKGRISSPDANAKTKAKNQALRITSVAGVPPTYNIGAISFLRNDILQFFWEDPMPTDNDGVKGKFELPGIKDDVWRSHYQTAMGAFRAITAVEDRPDALTAILRQADVTISIHPAVINLLLEEQWAKAKSVAESIPEDLTHEGYQLDGLRVQAGKSWLFPFKRTGLYEG